MATKGNSTTHQRIVVVDDEKDTCLYFQDVLQAAEDFRFAGSFANARDALNGIPRLQPDLVLMDIRLPDLDGIECTKRLKHAMPRLKIIIVTGRHDENAVRRSLQAGANDFLIKPVSAEQCLATLKFAAAKRMETEPNPEKSSDSFSSSSTTCLPISPRENEVLESLADGLLYKEISDRLGISYTAVRKYQHKLFQKLHVTNRSEAIRLWLDASSGKTQPRFSVQ